MMNLDFDFSFDFNENKAFGNASTTEQTSTRAASVNQLAMIAKLTEQKRQQAKDVSAFTFEEASAEIKRLIDLNPLSTAQKTLIMKKLAHLRELDVTIDVPESEIDKLTSGKDGTATQFIDQLIELERKHLDRESVSEGQIKTLVTWYLCPDMPFEDYGIALTKMTDIIYQGQQLKRRLTVIEFARAIQEHMNFQQASEFINRFRSVFHEWKKTRITVNQMRLVRKWEDRLADISKPTVLDLSINLDGEPVVVQRVIADKSKSWSPEAYMPIDQMTLLMYSKDEASRLIAQMEAEFKDKELVKYGQQGGDQDAFEDLRLSDSQADLIEREVGKLNDVVYAIMATLGQREEDFEHDEVRLIVERWNLRNDDTQVLGLIEKIYDLMLYAIDNNFISEEGLQSMVEKSAFAKIISDCGW